MMRRKMGVPHRSGDGAVAQQFLHGAGVHTALHPLRGPKMTEIVDGDPLEIRFRTAFIERPLRLAPVVIGFNANENIGTADSPHQ